MHLGCDNTTKWQWNHVKMHAVLVIGPEPMLIVSFLVLHIFFFLPALSFRSALDRFVPKLVYLCTQNGSKIKSVVRRLKLHTKLMMKKKKKKEKNIDILHAIRLKTILCLSDYSHVCGMQTNSSCDGVILSRRENSLCNSHSYQCLNHDLSGSNQFVLKVIINCNTYCTHQMAICYISSSPLEPAIFHAQFFFSNPNNKDKEPFIFCFSLSLFVLCLFYSFTVWLSPFNSNDIQPSKLIC